MTLDIISKHGLIIGFMSVLVHIPELVQEMPDIKDTIDETDFSDGRELQHLLFSLEYTVIALATMVAGIILIYGILQRKSWLLVPWLLMELLYSYGLAQNYSRGFEDITFYGFFIGMQALLFFPVSYLFVDIRRKNAAAIAAAKSKY